MLKANYHTHTYLCGHATGDVDDYVNEAIRLGFSELGMSDHAHTPEYFMTKDEYYDFINNNREIKVYNDLLNNITLNNLPIIYIKFLPMNVLLSINSLVYDKLCLFMDNKKELVLI